MINEKTFTKEWLTAVNEKLGWTRQESQLKNLEKATAALYLLESLKSNGLQFIFKGGTSLLLILKHIYRLSVDIDIIVESKDEHIVIDFDRLCADNRLFYRWEKQTRESDELFDCEHYRFFYHPYADDGEESYILLDLYFSVNPYVSLTELEITSDILFSEGKNLTVTVPAVDCILADKLTAFAPETIGIPLSAEPGKRPKRVEILKQLFDIGNLFDLCYDIKVIKETYINIAEHEIKQMKKPITHFDVLEDTLYYAFLIGHGSKTDKEKYDSLKKGYNDFNRFVSDLSFDENKAVLSASKAAYLATLLKSDYTGKIQKCSDEIDMTEWVIAQKDYKAFNDYKFSNPQAFFYWYKTINI